MNNIKWVWHILIRADSVFYASCARNIQCLPFDHHQTWPSSMDFLFPRFPQRFPLYISNTRSYCSHPDRNFPEAQTEHKQTSLEKNIERQREKGENSSVVHLADDILCTLAVISFSSARMDRISPLSFSLGWLPQWSPWRHLFSSVSLAPPRSRPLCSCYFSETLWISYNPFFLPHLLSYFLISAPTRIQHLPLDKLSVHLSVCLSTPPLPPPHTSFPLCLVLKPPWEKYKMKLEREKKIIEIYIFQEKS